MSDITRVGIPYVDFTELDLHNITDGIIRLNKMLTIITADGSGEFNGLNMKTRRRKGTKNL